MKRFKQIFVLLAIFLIATAPLAAAAPATTTCHEQGSGKQNPTNIGGYDLAGPVVSGDVIVTDVGNVSNGKKTTLTDLIEINKEVAPQGSNYQVDLTIEARPAKLSYNPPPQLDVIFVYDVTSSMVNPIDRLRNAQAAIKQSAEDIWAENPDSTITIIPYTRDVFTPLPTGGLSFNDTNMYTSASYNPAGGYGRHPDVNTTNATYLALVDARTPANISGDIGTIFENDYLYYRLTKADVDSMTSQMDTFNDSIDALPVGSDTNTHSGLKKAYEFLTTDSNFTANTEQKNRVVILITDGNAGRWINSADAVNAAGSYDRPSVLEAHVQAKTMADKIKTAGDGHSIMYTLGLGVEYAYFVSGNGWGQYGSVPQGIRIDPNTIPQDYNTGLPSGNSYIDVAEFLEVLPTSPAHYFNADSANMIESMMSQAVTSSTHYYAPVGSLTVKDEINSDLFDLVSGSITISVNGSPAVPLSTYPTATFTPTSFSVDLEDNPLGTPLTAQSKTEYVISYEIQPKTATEGGHLHVGNDNKSYVSYIAPEHHTSPNDAVYQHVAKNTYYVPFNTPTVQIGFYIVKEVSADGGTTWFSHVTLPVGGGTVDYRITIGNEGGFPYYIDRVTDKIGETNPELIYADKANNNLLGAAGVTAPQFNITPTPTKIENGTVTYEITYAETYTAAGTYKNTAVIKGFTIDTVNFDTAPSGQLRDSTAIVTVERANGGGGGNGGGTVVDPRNNTTVPNQNVDQPTAPQQTAPVEKEETPIEKIDLKNPIAAYFILIVLIAIAIYVWRRRRDDEEED